VKRPPRSRAAMLRCPPRRRSFAPWGGPAALSRLDRGFTLVEALLALAIFGVIAVLAYRATASLSEGEARLSAEAQHWHTLETLFTRFEADIRQAVPRSARVGAAREPAWIGTLYDGQSAVVFTRAGSEFVLEATRSSSRIGPRSITRMQRPRSSTRSSPASRRSSSSTSHSRGLGATAGRCSARTTSRARFA